MNDIVFNWLDEQDGETNSMTEQTATVGREVCFTIADNLIGREQTAIVGEITAVRMDAIDGLTVTVGKHNSDMTDDDFVLRPERNKVTIYGKRGSQTLGEVYVEVLNE